MGIVHGMENATAELLAYTPEQEEDRMGDTVDVPAWTAFIEIPVRFQTARELQRSEYGRYIEDEPAVYVDPSRIPHDLADEHDALTDDHEWPYVAPDQGRVAVNARTYEVTEVREKSLTTAPEPEMLVLRLAEVN